MAPGAKWPTLAGLVPICPRGHFSIFDPKSRTLAARTPGWYRVWPRLWWPRSTNLFFIRLLSLSPTRYIIFRPRPCGGAGRRARARARIVQSSVAEAQGGVLYSSELLPSADQTGTTVLDAPVATGPVLDEIKGSAHVRLPNVREDTPRCIDGALQILRGGVHGMQ